MKPTELSIDIEALWVTLFDTPSIEDSIKDTLHRLCAPPKTLSEVDFFILSLNGATSVAARAQAAPQIDISVVDKGIQKAKFMIVVGEDDYI